MTSHDLEKWVKLYQLAMLELEQSLMAGRITDARAEITRRVEALRDIPGLHAEELQAIEDALNNLRFLEGEDIKLAGDEHRNKAAFALERLRSIAPRIRQPDEG